MNEGNILGQESLRSHHLGFYLLYIHLRSDLISCKDYPCVRPKDNNLEVTLDRLNRMEVGDGQNKGREKRSVLTFSVQRETLLIWTRVVAVKMGLKKHSGSRF